MIIEIKDMPKDRQVKQITFDILFEDGDVVDIEKIVRTEPKREIITQVQKDRPIEMVEDSVPGFNPSIRPNIANEPREKKEIPPEMLEQTF